VQDCRDRIRAERKAVHAECACKQGRGRQECGEKKQRLEPVAQQSIETTGVGAHHQ